MPSPVPPRRRQPELMDQPGLDAGEHRRALSALQRVNVLSGTAGAVWSGLVPFLPRSGEPSLRVLDVACGGGDVTTGLAARANAAGAPMHVVGCDVSETALAHARAHADRAGVGNVEFVRADAVAGELPGRFDVVTSTLFLHHLDEPDAVALLRKSAAAASRAVIVDDLRRTRLGYAMAWAACRLLTRSPVVRIDGPLSVQGAFTTDEALALADRAGLPGATVSRHWPQRFLLVWRRP